MDTNISQESAATIFMVEELAAWGRNVNGYWGKGTGTGAQSKPMVLEIAVLPPTRKMEAADFSKMLVLCY
jgi:hypothetical protein